MTGHEISPPGPLESPYRAEVEEKTRAYADEVGRKAAEKFLKVIQPHFDIFLHDEVVRATDRELWNAVGRATEERNAGLHNDVVSTAPGIFVTGLLDYRSLDRLRENLTLYGVEHELEVDENSEIERIYRLHLPQGAFSYNYDAPDYLEGAGSQDFLWLYASAEIDDAGKIHGSTWGMQMGLTGGYLSKPYKDNAYGWIGRVEGAGGTLWQNPGHNPDGTFRREEQASAA